MLVLYSCFTLFQKVPTENFVTYKVNPTKETVSFYWKNENNLNFGNLLHLKATISVLDFRLILNLDSVLGVEITTISLKKFWGASPP